MTPFLKKHSRCWFITVPRKDGGYARLSSGTHDFQVATAMQAMVVALGRRGSRDWDIIDAIVDRRANVAVVFDHYPNDLERLRAEIADEDLAGTIDA